VLELQDFVVDLSSPGARRLFEYWVHGEGAVKVRWFTDGSMKRCIRHLTGKVRDPGGLCAEYHKAATGEWPAEKGIQSSAGTEAMQMFGLRWRGLLALVGKSTGDRRRIKPGALSTRHLPLPLLWQRASVAGKHDGAVVVGLADRIEMTDTGIWGEGDLFTPDPSIMPRLAEDVAELRYITEQGLGGPSVDIQLDDLVFEYQGNEAVVTNGRIAAITLVQVPAFAETKGAFEIYDHEGLLLASVGVMRPFDFITLDQWEEKKHPRDAEGKFKEKPGGGGLPDLPSIQGDSADIEDLFGHITEANDDGQLRVRPMIQEATSTEGVVKALVAEMRRLGNDHAAHEHRYDFKGFDLQTSKDYAEGILKVLEIFPKIKFGGAFPEGQARGQAPRAWAHAHVGGAFITFSQWWSSSKHRDQLEFGIRQSALTNWSSPNSDDPQSVAIHEAMHILHYELTDQKEDLSQLDRMQAAIEQFDTGKGDVDRGKYGISRYANKNLFELFAEAGTDVLINGDDAAPASKKVFQMAVEDYERRLGPIGSPFVHVDTPQQKTAKKVRDAFDKFLTTGDASDLRVLSKKELTDATKQLTGEDPDPRDEMLALRLRLLNSRKAKMKDRESGWVIDFVDRLFVRERSNAEKVLSEHGEMLTDIAKHLGIKTKRKEPEDELRERILDRIFGAQKKEKAPPAPKSEGQPEKPKVLGDDDYAKFRYFLELKRDKAGSTAALAEELGVNRSTLDGWLKGRKPRDKALVARILDENIEKVKINSPEVDRINNAFRDLIDKRDRTGLDNLHTDELRRAVKEAGIKGVRANASRDTLIKKLLEVAHSQQADKPGFGHFVDRLYAVSRTEGRKMLKDQDVVNIANEAGIDIFGMVYSEDIIKKILDGIHRPWRPRLPDPPIPKRDVPKKSQKYHLNLEGIEDLAKRVEAGFEGAERKRIAKGAQGGLKERITLPDGTKIFGKQLHGDIGLGGKAKDIADREQLASRVGQLLGAPVPRVYRTGDDQIYTDWAEGAALWGVYKRDRGRFDRAMQSDDAKLLGLLDLLVNNHDRHNGNMTLTKDGRLTGIDHGLAWNASKWLLQEHDRTAKENRLWGFAQGPMVDHYLGTGGQGQYLKDNPLTQDDIDYLRGKLKELEPEFEHLEHPDWYKYMHEVLGLLEPYAKGKKNLVAPERPKKTERTKSVAAQRAELRRFHADIESLGDLPELVAQYDDGRGQGFQIKDILYEGGMGGHQVKVAFDDGRAMFMKDFGPPVEEWTKERIDAEQLGAEVARALGVRAPRAARDEEGRIFTNWIEGVPYEHWSAHQFDPTALAEVLESPEARRISLLDVLIANDDRHEYNVMVDQQGRIHAIDHGRAWREEAVRHFYTIDDEEKFLKFIDERPIFLSGVVDHNGYFRGTKADLDEIREKLHDLHPSFKKLDREKWLRFSLDMVDELEKILPPANYDSGESDASGPEFLPDVPEYTTAVRPALEAARTAPEVRRAFAQEATRITGRFIPFIASGSGATAREHAEGILRGLEMFPKANLRTVTEGSLENAYAVASWDTVIFNYHWTTGAGRKDYLASLAEGVVGYEDSENWHPRGSDNPIAIALHEFAHILDIGSLSQRIHKQVNALVTKHLREARKRLRALGAPESRVKELTRADVIQHLVSEYATTNTIELIAEAFIDAMVNRDQASSLSREIFDLLKGAYDKKHAEGG